MTMSMSRNGADIDESLFGNTMPRGQRTKGNRTNLLIVGKDTVQVVRPVRNADAASVSSSSLYLQLDSMYVQDRKITIL